MASPKHSSPDHAGAPVAAPAATTLDRLPPWDGVPFYTAIVGVTVITGQFACAFHDRADALVFLAFGYVNIILLALSARWFDHAPPRSAARRASGLALSLLTASLVAGFSWKVGAEHSLSFMAFLCVVTGAPPVAAYLYVVFVLREYDVRPGHERMQQ